METLWGVILLWKIYGKIVHIACNFYCYYAIPVISFQNIKILSNDKMRK